MITINQIEKVILQSGKRTVEIIMDEKAEKIIGVIISKNDSRVFGIGDFPNGIRKVDAPIVVTHTI